MRPQIMACSMDSLLEAVRRLTKNQLHVPHVRHRNRRSNGCVSRSFCKSPRSECEKMTRNTARHSTSKANASKYSRVQSDRGFTAGSLGRIEDGPRMRALSHDEVVTTLLSL
ncbi:unnamed protein product [Cercospora beticola]|nr:unnamed protein product [Cercospora beticola]